MKSLYFRSNGKLMISGEYLVLAGAEALAIPVKYGQSMNVSAGVSGRGTLEWIALQFGKEWFRTGFETSGFQPENSSDEGTALTLQRLLRGVREMNPEFLKDGRSWKVVTDLEFDRNWGLGSSSTLVSNLAWWAGVDPYKLLFRTMGGSGYDIACARSAAPLIFKYKGPLDTPMVTAVKFHPSFSENLYFVYSGEKQSTAGSLRGFDAAVAKTEDIHRISAISREMAEADSLDRFMELMTEHEVITGSVTGKTPVQISRFPDFPGAVKSLGAWGGDFVLAASDMDRQVLGAYFESRGCGAVFPFDKMEI
jgi:mevalonate kinase